MCSGTCPEVHGLKDRSIWAGAQLRAGLNLELWASGEAAAGLRHPELRVSSSALSLGGVELNLGLELGVWFPVGPAPARRPRSTGP